MGGGRHPGDGVQVFMVARLSVSGQDNVANTGGHKGPHSAPHHPRPYGLMSTEDDGCYQR
jgi:hypothetical protein